MTTLTMGYLHVITESLLEDYTLIPEIAVTVVGTCTVATLQRA